MGVGKFVLHKQPKTRRPIGSLSGGWQCVFFWEGGGGCRAADSIQQLQSFICLVDMMDRKWASVFNLFFWNEVQLRFHERDENENSSTDNL